MMISHIFKMTISLINFTLEDKFKESVQVFWTGTRDVYVRVSKSNSSGDGKSQCSRFSTSSSCGQRYSRPQSFFRDTFDKFKDCLCLKIFKSCIKLKH